MQYHIDNKIYHIELLPPKQNTQKLSDDLDLFVSKYNRVMESGYCACITDNAMGYLAFQGTEVIEEMGLKVNPEQVMIHLNTFHTKIDLHNILDTCINLGIKYLLIISGDGSDRLPKLQPKDVNEANAKSVTSVELLKYINDQYPGKFDMGVAFNTYEPPEHEFEKLERKMNAGAKFIITQPIIERNEIVEKMIDKYPDTPVVIEAWMSKKLYLLSDAVGYEIPQDTEFDPIETLKGLHKLYPDCGFYLSILGFKTQYHLITDTWK